MANYNTFSNVINSDSAIISNQFLNLITVSRIDCWRWSSTSSSVLEATQTWIIFFVFNPEYPLFHSAVGYWSIPINLYQSFENFFWWLPFRNKKFNHGSLLLTDIQGWRHFRKTRPKVDSLKQFFLQFIFKALNLLNSLKISRKNMKVKVVKLNRAHYFLTNPRTLYSLL